MVAIEEDETIAPDEPVIDLPARLRHALSLLLESGAPRLIVREADQPVGYLDLPAIQAASIPRVTGGAP
jgi:hypothetical protein